MKQLTLGLIALVAAFASAAVAETPDLAAPPKDARTWSITSAGGAHGEEKVWIDAQGVRHARTSLLLRGLVTEIDQAAVIGADGLPTEWTIRGATPQGDAGEKFKVENGVATWTTPADSGNAPWRADLVYIPYGGPVDGSAILIAALLKDPDRKLDALPGGGVRLEELTTLEVSVNGAKKKLRAVELVGLAFEPQILWIEENGDFFGVVGWLAWLPAGWESVRGDIINAENRAIAARAPTTRARLLKDPGAPVLFRKVKIYDAPSKSFKKNMSVLVEGAKITAVGKKVNVPEGARIFAGKGKTLVPGLFDMHYHTGGDGSGVLALSQGVTSVRDIGNDRAMILARKRRIDRGELLGPATYMILGMDGQGPLAAQGFVRIASVAEGEKALEAAKADGFLGVKLYGTITPSWVKPLAAKAHALGMSVQGHIPAGMRPSEAVAAGYDGINHINFVMMEAMPDDVVATSNGLNRFFGPGRHAKDVDLGGPPMAALIETLAARKTVIDPTLVVYEGSYVPDQGEVAPSYAPYLGTVPPQIERQFKSGGLVAPEGYAATRQDMRAGFEKFIDAVRLLHESGVPIVAGTDGLPSDLIRELELYRRAGFSNGEALETATLGAARALGLDGVKGAIAPGMAADLLLVDGDVSKSLAALRQVNTIMLGGSLIDGEEIRQAVGITGAPKVGE